MMAPFIWELGGDLVPRLGEGNASWGPRAAERELRGLARAARGGEGVGLRAQGKAAVPQGLPRRAPGSRLHAAEVVAGCREGLGTVPHSPPEVKGHRAAEPVGALQARRAAAPRGSEPAANASLAAPPPPAGPTLATRLPPPGSDAPRSPLGAAASPAAPSAARLKGPKGRRAGAGWEWDAAPTQLPKSQESSFGSFCPLIFFPRLCGASGQIPLPLAVGFVFVK